GVAPLPVDLADDGVADGGRRARLQEVPHLAVAVRDVDDGAARERAGVVGLAAGGGVEGGAVEAHPGARLGGLGGDDGPLEPGQVAGDAVEAHAPQTSPWGCVHGAPPGRRRWASMTAS